MVKAVIFDFGHTIMDEQKYRGIPLRFRPIVLMPYVRYALSHLTLPMGIWVNSTKSAIDIKDWLKRASLDRYFRWIVSSHDIRVPKTCKRIFSPSPKRMWSKKE